MATKTLGILGGMGPHASANFLALVHREMNLRGIYEDSDFPRIVYLGLPLSDWDVTGAVDKDSVARQVAEGVRWLRDARVDVIAIPCNSVHEFHGEVSASLGIPVLHIIHKTLEQTWGTVGVLCSRQSRQSGLYEHGKKVLYAISQDAVDDAVASVIAGRQPYIDPLLTELREKGADSLVLGCTELSLCRYRAAADIVDSAQVLAKTLASYA